MEVRSYYATSVEAAMAMARKELGAEAMLIQSRQSPADLAHLGRYEVVFAGEQQAPVPSEPAPRTEPVRNAVLRPPLSARKTPPAPASPAIRPVASLSRNLREIPDIGPVDLVGKPEFQVDFSKIAMPKAASGRSAIPPSAQPRPEPPTVKPKPANTLAGSEEISRGIVCDPGLGRTGSGRPVVALVGPPGAGKSSCAMKLALAHGLLVGRTVRIVSFEPQRVGATEQVRRFAQLLDVDFIATETLDELSSALKTQSADLTLIDTPGYGRVEAEGVTDLARGLRSQSGIETHLVLRVDRRNAANYAAVDRFSILAPDRLILTALDEAPYLHDVRTLIDRAAVPVSFLGTGQRVPEDLEAAASSRLADIILNGWNTRARAAA